MSEAVSQSLASSRQCKRTVLMRPTLAILLLLVLNAPSRSEQRGMIINSRDAPRLPRATTGPVIGRESAALKPFACVYGASPAGIAVSAEGRVFVSFPGWGDAVKFTVGELTRDRGLVPFPKSAWSELKSVQGIFIDAHDRLWLLDNAARRLFAYDLNTDRRGEGNQIPPPGARAGRSPT